MIAVIVSYFSTFVFTLLILRFKKIKFAPLTNLYMKKNGIVFKSNKNHRLYVENCKLMQLDKMVYITKNNKMIILNNVDNVRIVKNFIYFKALGKVEIIYNFKEFYRYFNIDILSNKIDINQLKQLALVNAVENIFDLKNAEILIKYLKILKNVLNISLFKEKIVIKKNKFKIPFTVKYRVGNVVKYVNINETF